MSKVNVEALKAASNGLRGTIGSELREPSERFSDEAAQLLKFHGVYQQDDRDARKALRDTGGAKDHVFMVRTKNPGGYAPAAFYLAMDRIADSHGNGTLRVTTRQGLQLHGVRKSDLHAAIAEINRNLGTTLGACGDINRNVMAPPAPFAKPAYSIARRAANEIADLLTPRTGGYYEIWQDGEAVFSSEDEVDPLYRKAYLPRKFKIATAVAGDNSVDLYTNDIGVVPILDAAERLLGYDLTVGGGLGMTHGKRVTYPRLADEFAFVKPHELLAVVRAIVAVQRDNGDRADRRHARLKYLIADRGLDWFRSAVEVESGIRLEPWRELPVWRFEDYLGWHAQGDGRFFLGISIENGRIKDGPTVRLKSALREIVEAYRTDLVLTPNQNALIVDVAPAARTAIDEILRRNGVPALETISLLERRSMACPALPTCGLALAEAERALPAIIERIEQELQRAGLDDAPISVRMTGCPNGCARPYMGEIGIVGVSADTYNLYLGGDDASTRLNRVYRERVRTEAIPQILAPLFTRFAAERTAGEGFGDWCMRSVVTDLVPTIAEEKVAVS